MYKVRIYDTISKTVVNTIVRGGDKLLKNKILSVSSDDEDEEILHFATQIKDKIIMVQVNTVTGSLTETARYTGFTPKYAIPTNDKDSIYLIHQDKKTKIHELYCARYLFEDEVDEEKEDDISEESDGIVRVERTEIEPIGELGTFINLFKIVGSLLVIITTDDEFKSTLTIYNNEENIFLMKQERLIKNGKRVKPYEKQEFYSFVDITGAISESSDLSLFDEDKIYTMKNMTDDSVDILRLFGDDTNIKDNTFTIKEIQGYKFHYPFMAMLKGGKEIFVYDFTNDLYSYTRMNSPIISITSTESVRTSIIFRVLFDIGPYYVYGVLETKN